MSRWALTDIYQLLPPDPALAGPPAGAGERWGFFWPRDGAFLIVALHRTGHHEEARGIADFMSRLPFDRHKGFDARYLLGGGRVRHLPRGPQSDGCGWVLWALGEMSTVAGEARTDLGETSTATGEASTAVAGDDGRDGVPPSAVGLRDRCVGNLLDLTGKGRHLPPRSPDYWEMGSRRMTLGTVAPMVLGLRAASRDYRRQGRWAAAATSETAAMHLRAAMVAAYAPAYERFPGGGGMDAATAFLMPPFLPEDAAVVRAWKAYQAEAGRVSGGLAPGSAGKLDGTAWAPGTALAAYTAAPSGQARTAARWLDWLDRNRTSWGSLPEKVTRTGRPAGPAPLLWTSSLVLLTLAELDAQKAATDGAAAPTRSTPSAKPATVPAAPVADRASRR